MLAWWHHIDNASIIDIKAAVALFGAAVLAWFAPAHSRPQLRRGRRLRDVLLATAGALSCACWFNLGHYHFEGVLHYYDLYHYYLGAKYPRELGYTASTTAPSPPKRRCRRT